MQVDSHNLGTKPNPETRTTTFDMTGAKHDMSTRISMQFLMLKGPDTDDNKVESMEHCEKFWYWLQDKGISAHRSAIVKAIAMKVNGLLPGVYDADLYDDDDDE